MKMNSLFVVLIFGYIQTINLENVYKNTSKTLPGAFHSAQGNETSGTVGVSVKSTELSSTDLSELHNLAKNISHSKGIYREVDKELSHEQKLRRSVLKKATVASDSDTMRIILQRLDMGENQLQLLQHMEFLVHQYDVAINFATVGGFKKILPFLLSSDDEIVSSVASVLGAAMQSNPSVQNIAMKQNIGKKLLQLLSHKSLNVISHIMFALASLLRNTPYAQDEFIANNGILKLADILKNDQINTKTKLKVINLLNDLAVEQQSDEFYPDDWNTHKIQEFKRLFAHKIQTCDICKILPSFLDFKDFDLHEKSISAMMSLFSICSNDFSVMDIKSRLKKLLEDSNPESDSNSLLYPHIHEDLRQVLYTEIHSLIKKLNAGRYRRDTTSLKSKEEL